MTGVYFTPRLKAHSQVLGYMIFSNGRNDRVALRMATPKTEKMFSVGLGSCGRSRLRVPVEMNVLPCSRIFHPDRRRHALDVGERVA